VYPVAQRATPDALGAAQVQQQMLREQNRPGFELDSRPVSEILDGAVTNAASGGEGQFIAYDRGTPKRGQELQPRRFANSDPDIRQILIARMDRGGGLASVADDRKFKPGQDYFRATAERIFDSPMNGAGGVA
jgi:hypothetical protein